MKRESIAVPKICSTKLFPDVKDLKHNSSEIDEHTKLLREKYAKLVLLLFYPFRIKSDLTINESFWEKYQHVIKSGGFSALSLAVMQNIQDVNYNCVRDCQRLLDPILHDTILNKTDEDKEFMKKLHDEKDDDYTTYEELQKAYDSLGPDTGYEPLEHIRTMHQLINRHDVSCHKTNVEFDGTSLQSLNPPQNILTQIESIPSAYIVEDFQHVNHFERNPLLIEYIAYGVLDTNMYDQNVTIMTEIDSKMNMEKFAESIPLDFKQTVAFEVMACSYLLKAIEINNINMRQIQKVFCEDIQFCLSKQEKLKELKNLLHSKGGETQLFMFLSGMGGSGKSRVINAVKTYIAYISHKFNWHFDFHTIKITAMTGSAAALLNDGRTLHSAACLNKDNKNIDDNDRREWKYTNMLIIDEVSFMDTPDLIKTDRKTKILKESEKLFGGVHVVLVGDFHQLNPVGCKCPLYRGSNIIMKELNKVIFLNKSHRFKNDTKFGKNMNRLRNGTITTDYIDWLNERFVEEDHVTLPPSDKLRFACNTNEERNAVSNALFLKHLGYISIKGYSLLLDDVLCPL